MNMGMGAGTALLALAARARRRVLPGRAGLAAVIVALLVAAPASADPPSTAIRYAFDGAGQLHSVTDPASASAIFSWDPVGNLLAITHRSAASLSILQVSPGRGAAGSHVTIYGTGFSATASADNVSFNGTSATVASASAAALEVVVPAGATTGTITVTTSAGTDTSDDAFVVAASGPSVSSVSPSVANPGDAVTVNGSGFDPTASNDAVVVNQTYGDVTTASGSAVTFSTPEAGSGAVSVDTPDGRASGPDLFVAPPARVASDVGYTGRTTIGGSKTVTLSSADKVGLLLFDASARQKISVQLSGSTISGGPTFRILNPDRTTLVSTQSTFIDQTTLPLSGTYTFVVDAKGLGSGSITVKINDATDVASNTMLTPTASGSAASLSTSAAGQNMVFSFTGTAGQVIGVKEAGFGSSADHKISILKPDGTSLVGPSSVFGSWGSYFIDKTTLPVSGTYTIYVDPNGTQTSSSTVTAYDVPADVTGTLTPTPSGASTTVTTSPGQNAAYTFSGTAGQRVALRMSGSSYTTTPQLSLAKPDGSNLVAPTQSTFVDAVTLPVDGTYKIVVNPQNADGGSMTLTAWDASDATSSSTLTPSTTGDSASLSTSTPGQNMAFTFHGTAGEVVGVKDAGFASSADHKISILKPDGSSLVGPSTVFGSWGSYFIERTTLPADGTYTVYVDPNGMTTMSSTVTVYDIPPDVAGTLTPTPSGAATTVSTSAGQNAAYTFSGTAGQRVALRTTGSSYPSTPQVSLVKPDGSNLVSPTYSTFVDAVSLPATGTYKIVVDPQKADSGSLTLTAYDAADASSPSTLTPSAAGASASLTTTTPGQNMVFSFAGTAGQIIALKEAGFGSSADHTISIRKPDGSSLVGPSTVFGSWGSYYIDKTTLPVSGTYTIYVDPSGAQTSSSTVTVYDVPADLTGTLSPTPSGAATTVSTTAGQNASYTFAGTAGQRISLATSSSSYASAPQLSIVKPDGSNLVSPTQTTFVDAVGLPTTGTYRIVVNPQNADSGSMTLTAYDASDATSSSTLTPSATGDAASLSTSTPGQNMAFAFSGTAGQVIAVKEAGFGSSADHKISIRKPDGSNLVGPSTVFGSWGSYFIDKTTLPVSGTYTIYVDPNGTQSSSSTVTVYAVPSDVTDTMTIQGPPLSFSTTPGQNASFTFAGTSGKTIHLNFTNVTETVQWSVKNPSGSVISGTNTLYSGNTTTFTTTLNATGTYTITVDPQGAASGGLTLTLLDPPGTVPPFSIDTTLPRVFREPPFVRSMARRTSARQAACHSADGGLRGHRTPRACASAARVPRATFRAPSDVWRDLRVDRPATAVVLRNPGQKATLVLHGTGEPVTLRTAELSAPAYLLIRRPEGRDLVRPLLLRGATSVVRLRLAAGRTYSAVVVPARVSRAAFRVALTTLGKRPQKASSAKASAAKHVHRARHRTSAARRIRAAGRHGLRLRRTAAPSGRRVADPAARVAAAQATEIRRLRHHHGDGDLVWRPGRQARRGAWRTGRPASLWTKLPALRAAAGDTAVSGQALRLDGTPLPRVEVSVKHTRIAVRTDATGRFLLRGLDAGHRVLVVDGTDARQGPRRYGRFEVGVDVVAHRTTPLGYPFWMTALDPAGDRRVDSPTKGEVVLTTPRIPGLEVRIPAGSTIRDSDGKVVRDLNMTQVPVDRPPFPLPADIVVPTYFTVQPGGAYLSKGAQIVYPNYAHLPAGQRVDFWNYDAEKRGWYIYGRGTVTPDAKQVMPDPDVRVWELTGAMISSSPTPPPWYFGGAGGGGGASSGDPVDLSTGLFVHRKTDMVVRDTVPITLRRTYRQADSNSYAFGVGMNLDYNLRLWSVTNYQAADLILPDGSRVHYVRTSSGTDYYSAVYAAQGAPGRWYHSTLAADPSVTGWNLTTLDGTTYKFGEFAPLQAIVDRYGNRLTLTRSPSGTGNITKITTAHGRWMSLSYDGSNRVTQATDYTGRSTSYTYNSSGRLASVTDPAGNVTTYGYDSAGDMTTVHDARGHDLATLEYDTAGRVSKQTAADGGVYQYSYTLNGNDHVQQTTVTEPEGSKTVHVFDSSGFETSITRDADGSAPATTSFARDASRQVTSVTDPLGRVTSFTHNDLGDITSVTQLAGTADATTTQLSYDPRTGMTSRIADPLGHARTMQYDSMSRLTAAMDATGHKTTLGYTAASSDPTSITDPLGHAAQLGYFGGELSSVTDALGHHTNRYLDAAGRVAAVTDQVGNRTGYEYDADDQLTKVIDAKGRETTLTHDATGNLTGVTDARGHSWTMTYDALGRRLTQTDPLGRTTSFAYDHEGRLVRVTDARGKTTVNQYDGLGRLTFRGYGAADAQGSPPFDSTATYSYDLAGALTSVADSASGTITLTRDTHERVTSVAGPDGTVSYTYDAAGRRTSMTADGLTTTYGYDDANRLTSITQGGLTVGVTYDDAGRRATVTYPNGVVQTLSYDAVSRLTGMTYAKSGTTLGDLQYDYDAAGHRIAAWGSLARVAIPNEVSSATYDDANEQTSFDGRTQAFDAAGDLTSDGTNSYSWNVRGQLSGVTGATSSWAFDYDALGRRVGKTVDGSTTRYLYDGGNVAEEIFSGLATGTDPVRYLLGLGPDERFARTSGGITRTYQVDGIGSTLALLDDQGAATTSYTYEPFGTVTPGGAPSSNPYQFAGRENDGTGLYANRTRYYVPGSGRFASQDPIGFAAGDPNMYRYGAADPLDFTDPSGRLGLPVVPDPVLPVGPIVSAAQTVGEGVQALNNLADSTVQTAVGGWVGLLTPDSGYNEVDVTDFEVLGVHITAQVNCNGHLAFGFGAGIGAGLSAGVTHFTGNNTPGQLSITGGGTANGTSGAFSLPLPTPGAGDPGAPSIGVGAGVGMSAGLTLNATIGPKDDGC